MKYLPHSLAAAAVAAGLAGLLLAPMASAQISPTATPTVTPTVTSTPATTTPTATATTTPAATAAPVATATPNPSTPHDNRFFSQTGFRIDNDVFWNYFNARGGLPTFGYATSRTFQFLGFTTQFFQRRIMQLGPDGNARLLNLFDQGLFPFTNINGSTFPAPDPSVIGAAPAPGSAGYGTNIITFIQQNAPNTFNGRPTNFYNTFASQVPLAAAFPNGGDTTLLPGFDLEMWGAVTSHPSVDPANNNFIYLRFQRGIMMFDGSTNLTQGVLLADYFKFIITGVNIPPDLDLQARGSSFYKQYNNSQPNGLNNPGLLPGTNMQFAFDPQ
ncbi:MAG TPA: hypothetical protein VK457_18010 [Chloroflexota bacterium]|nr:hypothetical protein [Chloroflexota bacterium]